MVSSRLTIGPMFGEIAMDLGLIQTTDLLEALSRQEEERKREGRMPRIGEILVGMGRIAPADVERVLAEVERRTWAMEFPGYHGIEHMASDDSSLSFRGQEKGTQGPVRIRLFRFSLAGRPELIGRFRRQCRALSRLDHPNLLRVLESGDLEGFPYYVMEDVLVPDLAHVVAEHGPLPKDRALDVVDGIADALAHAHSLGIVHGALRPAAVLLSRLTGPKVTDFALSGTWSVDGRPADSGGPHYLAPERARGGPATIAADVYSLGAVLFHLLTGRPPFTGDPAEVLRQHLRRPAPDPRVFAPAVSEDAAKLTLSLLEKDPGRRPAGMARVRSAVAAVRRAGNRAAAAAVGAEVATAGAGGRSAPARLRAVRRA